MAQTFDNTIFKVRADSKSNWDTNHPTIQERELIVDLTQCDFKVGDGSSWDNTQYLIARNATVTAARNAATAAQNTANTAQNTANQALQIAQNASGRYVNYEWSDFYDHGSFDVNSDVLKKRNFEYELIKQPLLGCTFNFGYVGPLDESNIIKIRFITGDTDTTLVSPYFANTLTDGKYLVAVEQHNDTALAITDYSNGTIKFAAGVFVEIEILNGTWFKIEVTKII